MIDWQGLFWNSLWIIGLAVMLSATGVARYTAISRQQKFSEAWGEAGIQTAFNIGSILISTSLAYFAARWWERAVWIFFAVLFMGITLFELYRKHKSRVERLS